MDESKKIKRLKHELLCLKTGLCNLSENITIALGFTPENVANKQNSLSVDGTGTKYPTVDAINSFGIVVDLIDALTVDFALSYAYKINSVTNITNAPTTIILDDGAAYTLTNTIAANSVMTITVNTAARIQLNVQKV